MAQIQLTDLVLLASNFQMWPRGAAPPPDTDDATLDYPSGEFVELSASTTQQDDAWVLYLNADLDDPQFPFKLSVLLGARFEIGDEDLTVEEAEKTLVWLCYPYLREIIASITGRSPLPPYYIPALTRMPDPSVLAAPVGPAPSETPQT